jgi:Flp pilus assembly protein TadD
MTHADLKGLAVSTTSADALAAYERGADLFLRWRSGALEALDTAAQCDPSFALAHCTRAYVAWRMGRVDLAAAAAQEAVARAGEARHEREREHVQAVAAMQRGEQVTAYDRLGQIAARYPTDRIAVRIVGLNCINKGDYRGGVDIARRSLEADPGEPQFQTMLGFFLEQSGYSDEGLEMSSRSWRRTRPICTRTMRWAMPIRAGATTATRSRPSSGRRRSSATRVLWHLAEAHAILGHTRMTREYWASTAPALPLYERIELLWRLEVLRQTATDAAVWQELARQADRVLEHADFQTVWMHHWIGVAFARAGEWGKARQQLERLRRLPEGRPSGYWSTLGASLLEGELAIVEGDHAAAVRLMAPAVEQIHTLGGGSREQKDIFRDVFMELHRWLARGAGHRAGAATLTGNPYHVQSLAALAWAYERSGNAALQRLACRQLVLRAEKSTWPWTRPSCWPLARRSGGRLIAVCRDRAED